MTPEGPEPVAQGMRPPPRRTTRWWLLLLVAASVPLVGEILGHGYFSALGNVFAHHGFHLATVIAGAGAFSLMVARDIKRNGVPPRLKSLERLYGSLRGGRESPAAAARSEL